MLLMMDFILEQPTVNGRLYTKENFLKASNKFMSQKHRLIAYKEHVPTSNTLSLESVIGTVNEVDVRGNGMVFVDCNFIETPMSRHVRTFPVLSISPFMIGKVDEETKIVNVESIEYFFVNYKCEVGS